MAVTDEIKTLPGGDDRRPGCLRCLKPSFALIAHNFLGERYARQQLGALTRADFDPVGKDDGVVALVAVHPETEARFLKKARAVGVALELEGQAISRAESRAQFYFFRTRPL